MLDHLRDAIHPHLHFSSHTIVDQNIAVWNVRTAPPDLFEKVAKRVGDILMTIFPGASRVSDTEVTHGLWVKSHTIIHVTPFGFSIKRQDRPEFMLVREWPGTPCMSVWCQEPLDTEDLRVISLFELVLKSPWFASSI
jgi:hypothetical protein